MNVSPPPALPTAWPLTSVFADACTPAGPAPTPTTMTSPVAVGAFAPWVALMPCWLVWLEPPMTVAAAEEARRASATAAPAAERRLRFMRVLWA
jgi:hypothetical protein